MFDRNFRKLYKIFSIWWRDFWCKEKVGVSMMTGSFKNRDRISVLNFRRSLFYFRISSNVWVFRELHFGNETMVKICNIRWDVKRSLFITQQFFFLGIHYIVPRTEENLIFGKRDKTGLFAAKTKSGQWSFHDVFASLHDLFIEYKMINCN